MNNFGKPIYKQHSISKYVFWSSLAILISKAHKIQLWDDLIIYGFELDKEDGDQLKRTHSGLKSGL